MRWSLTMALMAGMTATVSCMPSAPPSQGQPAPPAAAPGGLIPAGFGSLRQDEISVTLFAGPEGEVRLRVTPLAESVTRLTAPDTWERLSSTRAQLRAPGASEDLILLVSFYSESIGATFGPEDVMVWARGRRLRPLSIQPITPAWGEGRLPQREPLSALYRFDAEEGILTEDFDVEYRMSRSGAWRSILLRLDAERARVRARAGG